MKFESIEQAVNDRLFRQRDGLASGGNICPKTGGLASGGSIGTTVPQAHVAKGAARRRANPQRPACDLRLADATTPHRP